MIVRVLDSTGVQMWMWGKQTYSRLIRVIQGTAAVLAQSSSVTTKTHTHTYTNIHTQKYLHPLLQVPSHLRIRKNPQRIRCMIYCVCIIHVSATASRQRQRCRLSCLVLLLLVQLLYFDMQCLFSFLSEGQARL